MRLVDRARAALGLTARNIEDPQVPVSSHDFYRLFGPSGSGHQPVSIDRALQVPAFAAGVGFLSLELASMPLQAFEETDTGSVKIGGALDRLVNDFANDETSSHGLRREFWFNVFTRGRGLIWIERNGREPFNLWLIETARVIVRREGGRRIYRFDGRIDYPAADVIDVAFMPKGDGLGARSPIDIGAKALGLSLALVDYAATFFANGGVPPLALEGPLPSGPEAMKRAMNEVDRAISGAKNSDKPYFALPLGHTLKPIGIDPEKAQMEAARRLQIEEIARILGLPPVFVGDLTHGTLSNVEQQDLNLAKHCIGLWCKAFEDEANLKLFGRAGATRSVRHNLDSLLRGDFKTRMEGLARGVQNALITPNEGRAIENRAPSKDPRADQLFIQGATVPIEFAGQPGSIAQGGAAQ